MAQSLINPRIIYKFPSYIDPESTIEEDKIVDGIKSVLEKEFGLRCELVSVRKIFNETISSDGNFTSAICLDSGDLHHFAMDIRERDSGKGFDIIPREVYFLSALIFTWKDTEEIDYVKFDF